MPAFAELEPDTSTAEGLYWSITTMTTVGYGDLSPETTGARFLAVAIMLVGIGFVAILTGAVAERFLAQDVAPEAVEIEAELDTATGEVIRRLGDLRNQLDELEAVVRARR